jgi:hypothetical protein
MKSIRASMLGPVSLAAALALAAGITLTGCQSSTVSQSPSLSQGSDASASIQASSELISAARSQISRTTASLRNLVDRPQDTAAQYKVALDEIAKMKADASAIAASVAAMRERSDAYLAEWGRKVAAITNPELRDAALSRRGEVAARFQALYKSYQDVQAAYLPFQTGIAEIQTVLGADLSAKGLAAVRPFVAKVSDDAYPLNAALGKLADDFAAAGAALQPGGE